MKPKEILSEITDKEAEELVEILNVLRDVKKATDFKTGQQTIAPTDTNTRAVQGHGKVEIVVIEGKYDHCGGMIQRQETLIPHRLAAKAPQNPGSKIIH